MVDRPTLGIEPTVKTELYITPELKQSLDLLTLGAAELTSYVNEAALENPLLHVDPPRWQTSGWAGDRSLWKKRRPRDAAPFDPIAALKAPEPTLADRLMAALHALQLEPERLRDARLIVDALDERGFLGVPLEALAERFARPLERLEAALLIVQSLDPPGIGARDLRECLHLQHRRLGQPLPILTAIIDAHLEDVAKGRLQAIARRLRVPIEDVADAVSLLRTFHPKPGSRYAEEPIVYMIPEAAVRNVSGTLQVMIDDDVLPRLSIDPALARLQHDTALDPHTRDYVSRKIAQAQKLIEQLEARKTTLQRVLEAVVRRQAAYFLHGPDRLKPLTMQVVAEDVGLSVSTVSRTVRDKCIETPWGLIELRRLFPSSIGGEGEAATQEAVTRKIRAYIEAEDKTRPLSDADLAAALSRDGFPISRRTVAKYRTAAGIPPSHQRRQPSSAM